MVCETRLWTAVRCFGFYGIGSTVEGREVCFMRRIGAEWPLPRLF